MHTGSSNVDAENLQELFREYVDEKHCLKDWAELVATTVNPDADERPTAADVQTKLECIRDKLKTVQAED